MNELDTEDILAEPDESTWSSSLVNGHYHRRFDISHIWYLVAVAGIGYYLWVNKLSPRYYQWKENRKRRAVIAKTKKEPELEYHNEEARRSIVNRLQEEYNRLALRALEKRKEKEDKKRVESISRLSLQGGRKLNDNYYPLSGQGSRNYFVPPKRTVCQGGC